nr:soss complex subunit b1 [Hymenolepis microstoma]
MEKEYLLKDLRPNMKFVNTNVIVIDVDKIIQTKEGSMVRTVKVADHTGCINMSVWNLMARLISVGDLLKVSRANTSVRNGSLTLNIKTKLFKKPKLPKKPKPPLPPKDLRELVDRLTAGDNLELEAGLLSDLANRMIESNLERDDALLIIFQQIRRPRAQIRLNVVKLIKYLSSQSKLSLVVRESVLLQLQDIFPFCVPTANSDKPLPPPEQAANELQREMLDLLLCWERDETILKSLSPQSRGQLASLLRYLRTPRKQGEGNTRLKSAGRLLEHLEQEEDQRRRNALAADAIIRRSVTEARDAFRENRSVIEENLKSLEGVMKLLIPDIFEMASEEPSSSFSPSDFREHGMHDSGEVNISLSLNFVNSGENGDFLTPEVQVTLNEDNRLLRETGSECLNMAQDQHRPILDKFLELSRIFEPNPELSSILADDRSEVESVLNRLNRALSRFSAIRFIEEDTKANSSSDEDSNEDDDFIEVPPLPAGNFPSSSNPDSCEVINEERDRHLPKPKFLLMDKLPWEMEGHPTSSNSRCLQPSVTSQTATSVVSNRYTMKRRHEAPEECIILPPEDPKALIWKANESLHRFWKPFDTSEFEVPQLELEEEAISFLPSTSKSDPSRVFEDATIPAERDDGERSSSNKATYDFPTTSSKKFKPSSD